MPSSLKQQMFSDATSAAERNDRLEDLKKALAESVARHDEGTDGFMPAKDAERAGVNAGIQKGRGPGRVKQAGHLDALAERLGTIAKGLSAEEQAQVSEQLASLNAMKDTFAKDITVATPGNLHPYDLEAPAKVLVPRFTPLRNEISRTKGQGTAREYRRILGYSNSGLGGVNDLTPFFNSETTTNSFGSLSLRRGPIISYAMDVHTIPYMEMSVSDLVTWKAYFTDLGFEDVRQLSQMALLWSHLLGEEKALLWGRGSASGYSGAVSAPAATAATAGGGTIPAATYVVSVAAISGGGPNPTQTAAVTANGALVVSANGTITITLTTQPTGALGYAVYVGVGKATFQGVFVPGGASGNTITLTSFVSGGVAAPGSDTSSNANAYDGYLTILTNPANAGDFRAFNNVYPNKSIFTSGGSGNIGDQPFQDQFAALYASVYADPEEVWLAAPQRRQLADYLRSASNTSAAYRIVVNESAEAGVTMGSMIVGLQNESSPSGRVVDLRVHPYMPAGCSFTYSRVLPIPDSHIGQSVEMVEVQGYMGVDWPQIQFTYDASTYWYGAPIFYAPKWSGGMTGLQ